MVKGVEFNGGGGMANWKRVSFLSARTSFTNGSYPFRIDYNNNYNSINFWFTNLWLGIINDTMLQYGNDNGVSLGFDVINKEWCDRWIAGRSQPIIHIKDPNNTQIKFNTSYDVVCNDIEIRPEINNIILDGTTGTIKCKRLIREQEY